MSEAKTFLRAEVHGLGGVDFEARVMDGGASLWVDVARDKHGLGQLDTLLDDLQDLRTRFPATLILEANQKKRK